MTLLALEMRQVAGSVGCHHFHRRSGGQYVFVLVEQYNNNTLHTNLKCKIVQDSTKSNYNTILLQNTTKVTYNETLQRKYSQETLET